MCSLVLSTADNEMKIIKIPHHLYFYEWVDGWVKIHWSLVTCKVERDKSNFQIRFRLADVSQRCKLVHDEAEIQSQRHVHVSDERHGLAW